MGRRHEPFQRRRFVATVDGFSVMAADYEVDMLVSMVEQLIGLVSGQGGSGGVLDDDGDDPFDAWERELSGTSDLDDDPALDRLFPDAYEDDAAADEFRRFTQASLADRKVADAEVVLACLATSHDGQNPVLIQRAQANAWLRTLTALRLVLGARLNIEGPDDVTTLASLPENDPRSYPFAIFVWLEDWLEGLLRAL